MELPLMSQLRVKFSPAQAADPDCLLPLDDEVICMSFVVWLCAVATFKMNVYFRTRKKMMNNCGRNIANYYIQTFKTTDNKNDI